MRPMLLFAEASLRAAWTAIRAAEDRAAGDVSLPKKSTEGSKCSATWLACSGKARRGPLARAANAPLMSALWRVVKESSGGRMGPSSLEGMHIVIALPSRWMVKSDWGMFSSIGEILASQAALPFFPATSRSKTNRWGDVLARMHSR